MLYLFHQGQWPFFASVTSFLLIVIKYRRKMAYSGCLGKIFKYTLGQYMFVVFTHQKCGILSMDSGEVIVLVDARIMIHGIRTHSSD